MKKKVKKIIVFSLLGLFLGLSFVSASMDGAEINSRSITWQQIKERSIGGLEIGSRVLSWQNIAQRSIGGNELVQGAVGTSELANGAVTVGKMSSNNCSTGQILKYNGSTWACASDDNTGSSIGNTVESSEITDDTIVNADINSSAAIAYSKLNLGSNISSSNITDGTIVNNDINSSAAIDSDKISFSDNIVDLNDVKLGNSCSAGDCSGYAGQRFIKIGNLIFVAVAEAGTDLALITGGTAADSNLTLGNISVGSALNGKGRIRHVPKADPPCTCDSGDCEGSEYYDSDDHKLKICNGTAWTDLH